jgi:hypothetical protein
MSRVLAQLLGADEAQLRLHIQQLERAAGLPKADIRLGLAIKARVSHKLAQLGLDPFDTTGPELFRSLQQKIVEDEQMVRQQLHIPNNAVGAVVSSAVQKFLQKQHIEVFAIKHVALRKIMKQCKPKATMKQLGYRSMDSMLKHEPMPQLLAATLIVETKEWHAARLEKYSSLSPCDFEVRKMQFIVPAEKHWPKLSQKFTSERKTNVVGLPEAGSVVLLPIDRVLPAVALTTAMLALEAGNEIRAVGAFLKLHQVQPDFGGIVAQSCRGELGLDGIVPGQALSWHDIHWFFANTHTNGLPDAFEPHVQSEDMKRTDHTEVLAELHDSLAFWRDTHPLAFIHGKDVVSLNVFDVSVSVCNAFDYSERLVHNMRLALHRELIGGYLNQNTFRDSVGDAIERRLAPQLD